MKLHKTALLVLLNLSVTAGSFAQYSKYDTWEENYTVQALLGPVKYKGLKFDNTDGADRAEIDMSLIPQLGGAWGTMPKGEKFQCGLEASFLLGFRFDKVNYAYLGGSGAHVNISTSMWMFDFSGGGYANLWLTDNFRLYVAGGPLMMFANYDADREYTDTTPDQSVTESAFGLGVYARTGFEFQVHERGYLGLGVRGTWSSLDMSNVGGSTEVSGIAAFVTYTAGL